MFCGLGFRLLERFGDFVAIVVTGLTFAAFGFAATMSA